MPPWRRSPVSASPPVTENSVVVMGGFIGSTEDGVTTTLGRGGSDYTASIVGAGIDAEAIEIWTDVDGMLTADPTLPYPDFGCSFETFTNNEFLEIETLGPLTRVAPKGSVTHVERWSLHRGIQLTQFTDAELDGVFQPLLP